MKEKMLAFYKSIYPHTYHIDDAAMDCHIKGGRELMPLWMLLENY